MYDRPVFLFHDALFYVEDTDISYNSLVCLYKVFYFLTIFLSSLVEKHPKFRVDVCLFVFKLYINTRQNNCIFVTLSFAVLTKIAYNAVCCLLWMILMGIRGLTVINS